MTTRLDCVAEEPLDQAYAAYLTAAARLDKILTTATTRLDAPTRLREASQAVTAELESTAALALTVAAGGAPSDEIETAAETARAAGTACALALAEIGLTHPTPLRQAAQQLLAAAIETVFPAVPTLAVAS